MLSTRSITQRIRLLMSTRTRALRGVNRSYFQMRRTTVRSAVSVIDCAWLGSLRAQARSEEHAWLGGRQSVGMTEERSKSLLEVLICERVLARPFPHPNGITTQQSHERVKRIDTCDAAAAAPSPDSTLRQQGACASDAAATATDSFPRQKANPSPPIAVRKGATNSKANMRQVRGGV